MGELTRSRLALALAGGAAGISVLSAVLLVVGYALLSQTDTAPTQDLLTAGAWLAFVAAGAAFTAVAGVSWQFVLDGRHHDLWQVAGAAAATLLYAIGSLLTATEVASGSFQAGDVLHALGFGGWAVVLVAVAAVRSIAESKDRQLPRTSGYWLGAAGAVTLMAVAAGLPQPRPFDSAPGVVTGILGALGTAALLAAVAAARSRGLITTAAFPATAWAVAVLAVSSVVIAVSSAVVFAPAATVAAVRVGLSLPYAIAGAAYVVLAGAAWRRLDEIPARPAAVSYAQGTYAAGPHAVSSYPAGQPAGSWPPPPASTSPMHCGEALPVGAAFCPHCGARLAAPPP